jgi:predicted acetyltransferase
MGVEIAPCSTLDELGSALSPFWQYFGGQPAPAEVERLASVLEVQRMFSARENGAVVGGAGAYSLELTVPGGTVRAAGTTMVGVLPTHRRRGIMRSMMRAQIDDAHSRGEPLAILWPSEESIYGRFGYGMASLAGELDIPKSACGFIRPCESRAEVRLLHEAESHDALFEIYEQVRRQSVGMISRSPAWWKSRQLFDSEYGRAGGARLNCALVALDGKPQAYALYRLQQLFEGGTTAGHVRVIEALSTTSEATREVWRFLLEIDWVAGVKAALLPLDHPLFFLLARPRMMRFRVSDALWVRLVDVQAALSARKLADADPIVIAVVDEFCPWNEGHYRVGPDGVERTAADADIVLNVDCLASTFLGGFRFAQLAAAGRLEARTAGALSRADALFSTDRAPWCPEIF